MKRLLLAGTLALGIHAALFGIESNWLCNKITMRPEPHVLTMTFAFHEPQRPKPEPATVKPKLPLRRISPVKKRKPRHLLKPKAQKEIVKPSNTVKPPTQHEKNTLSTPEPPSEPEVTQMVREPYYPTPDFSEEIIHKGASVPVDKDEGMPEVPVVRQAIPMYRINPAPEYPRLARRRGYQGTVVLEVLVDPDGRVGDLHVFKSSGYKTLDSVAVKSVKEWLFEPGIKGDEKVEMWVKVPIRFQLK